MEQNEYTVASGEKLDAVPTDNKKAVAGGVVATTITFLSTLQSSLDGGVTPSEWLTIGIATIVAGAAAFGITYATPTRVK